MDIFSLVQFFWRGWEVGCETISALSVFILMVYVVRHLRAARKKSR